MSDLIFRLATPCGGGIFKGGFLYNLPHYLCERAYSHPGPRNDGERTTRSTLTASALPRCAHSRRGSDVPGIDMREVSRLKAEHGVFGARRIVRARTIASNIEAIRQRGGDWIAVADTLALIEDRMI